MKIVFIVFQYLCPQHAISRLTGKLAASERTTLKNTLIQRFIRRYKVDLSEAEVKDPTAFRSFNDFFTRALVSGARPIAAGECLVSPADGEVSQVGRIEKGRIFQAKGQYFDTAELLANADIAKHFNDGEFATIYLSPRDYHRVHMPLSGKLKSMTYVPGDLFSVNQTTAESVPRLFARNERVVAIFDTDLGPMALVLVGAMIVASIETVWAGNVAPTLGRHIQHWEYEAEEQIELQKGSEMGRFKLGSTAIVLLPQNSVSWEQNIAAGTAVKMGEAIAQLAP